MSLINLSILVNRKMVSSQCYYGTVISFTLYVAVMMLKYLKAAKLYDQGLKILGDRMQIRLKSLFFSFTSLKLLGTNCYGK